MPSTEHPIVLPLVGNPRPGSRTRIAAEAVAGRISVALKGPEPAQTIDLADLAGELFGADHPRVDAALAAVRAADVLVVATPVYKASYTGLLKSFLDLLPGDALRGVRAVPVTVSASPTHVFVGEIHLRPLLVELGASVPTAAIGLIESGLPDLPGSLDAWIDRHADAL
jgi:FMN reductase